jgi:hypothetical protein
MELSAPIIQCQNELCQVYFLKPDPNLGQFRPVVVRAHFTVPKRTCQVYFLKTDPKLVKFDIFELITRKFYIIEENLTNFYNLGSRATYSKISYVGG